MLSRLLWTCYKLPGRLYYRALQTNVNNELMNVIGAYFIYCGIVAVLRLGCWSFQGAIGEWVERTTCGACYHWYSVRVCKAFQ